MAASLAPIIQVLKTDTATISEGMAVKAGTDDSHVGLGAANTDRCIGIAQNATTAVEDPVEVARPGGGGKGLLGGTVSKGDLLVSDASGKLVKAQAAGNHLIAMADAAGVLNDLIPVLVIAGHAYAAE